MDRIRPEEWTSEKLLDNTEHRIAHHELELAWKSERLRETAEGLEVDTRDDGFVVDHQSSAVYMFGEPTSEIDNFFATRESSLCKEEWMFKCK
jgi:hypothetical protein